MCGILDDKLKKELLHDPDLTLVTAIRSCRVNDKTKARTKTLTTPQAVYSTDVARLHVSKDQQPYLSNQTKQTPSGWSGIRFINDCNNRGGSLYCQAGKVPRIWSNLLWLQT